VPNDDIRWWRCWSYSLPPTRCSRGGPKYLRKRNAFLRQNVHIVELDLLLGGHRLPLRKPLPVGDYHYFVCRSDQRPDCQVYSWSLRDPLPSLPVPLRAPFPDLHFNLATLFTTAYERGRFGRRIPYRSPCPAPLSDNDRTWIDRVSSHLTRGL
jgi:hypothetical protein